eukprot:jgi/Mesvir1/16951/Mv15802-RA.1
MTFAAHFWQSPATDCACGRMEAFSNAISDARASVGKAAIIAFHACRPSETLSNVTSHARETSGRISTAFQAFGHSEAVANAISYARDSAGRISTALQACWHSEAVSKATSHARERVDKLRTPPCLAVSAVLILSLILVCTVGSQAGDLRHDPPAEADALWYHIPDYAPRRPHRIPGVPTVAFSMESSANYPYLDDYDYMRYYDIEQTYRFTSALLHPAVPVLYASLYFKPEDAVTGEGIFRAPEPLHAKTNAVAFISANCNARNGRERLVRKMMDYVDVHAYGGCLRNRWSPVEKPPKGGFNPMKIEQFRRYRFCIVMENSNTVDYVTEKIYEGLTAGCLPLYMGAPNVQDFLPYEASTMILDRNSFSTDELFLEAVKRLSSDDKAYEKYMNWRGNPKQGKPFHPAFARFLDAYARGPSVTCELCQAVASIRYGESGTLLANRERARQSGVDVLYPAETSGGGRLKLQMRE